MAYLRKYRGGRSIKRYDSEPNIEIVAHVVLLCRSGNYSALQIKDAVTAAFPHERSRIVQASIEDACNRLLKQGEK